MDSKSCQDKVHFVTIKSHPDARIPLSLTKYFWKSYLGPYPFHRTRNSREFFPFLSAKIFSTSNSSISISSNFLFAIFLVCSIFILTKKATLLWSVLHSSAKYGEIEIWYLSISGSLIGHRRTIIIALLNPAKKVHILFNGLYQSNRRVKFPFGIQVYISCGQKRAKLFHVQK